MAKGQISLKNFFIFNPTYGPREGEEHKKILFYFPKNTDIDTQIKHVGLCEAIVTFTQTFTDKPCESLHTQKTRQLFFQPEKDFWMVMTVGVPFSEKSKDGQVYLEYHEEDVQDPVMDSVLRQAYRMFTLFNGSIYYLLQKVNGETKSLKQRLEHFFSRYLLTLRLGQSDLLDVFSGISFLPLDKNTYLQVQCFINILESTFPAVKYTAFLYNDQLVWSGLEQDDMRIMYKYLTTSLFPAYQEQELQSSGQQHSTTSLGRNMSMPNIGNVHFGKFVTGPPNVQDERNMGKIPRLYINTEFENEECFLIVYRALSASVCLLLNSSTVVNIDLCRKLDSFLGQQLSNLASEIGEQYSSRKQQPTSEPIFKYIYFNHMNLAQKTTVHVENKKSTGVFIGQDTLKLLCDISSDLKRLSVKKANVLPFLLDEIGPMKAKFLDILTKKRRLETIQQLLADVDWAADNVDEGKYGKTVDDGADNERSESGKSEGDKIDEGKNAGDGTDDNNYWMTHKGDGAYEEKPGKSSNDGTDKENDMDSKGDGSNHKNQVESLDTVADSVADGTDLKSEDNGTQKSVDDETYAESVGKETDNESVFEKTDLKSEDNGSRKSEDDERNAENVSEKTENESVGDETDCHSLNYGTRKRVDDEMDDESVGEETDNESIGDETDSKSVDNHNGTHKSIDDETDAESVGEETNNDGVGDEIVCKSDDNRTRKNIDDETDAESVGEETDNDRDGDDTDCISEDSRTSKTVDDETDDENVGEETDYRIVCYETDSKSEDNGARKSIDDETDDASVVEESDNESEDFWDDERDEDYVPETDDDAEDDDVREESNGLPNFLQFLSEEIKDTPRVSERNQAESGTQKPYQRKVKEDQIVRDNKYNKIYIKKFVKSKDGKSGLKTDDRPYDTVHACYFCKKLFTHIQDHIEKKHAEMPQVQEIAKLKKKMAITVDKARLKKEIKRCQDCLRFSGDHIHNLLVKASEEGELLIQRKSCSKEDFNVDDYGPCPECKQWIKLESSVRIHQKNCPKTVESPKHFGKNALVWQAKHIMGVVEGAGSKMLHKEVLSKMRKDEISTCAQEDHLICNLGDVWLSKSIGHELRRGRDSSFHMRLAAKLLLECRTKLNKPSLDMEGLLTMKYFDTIIEVTLQLCGKNEHDELLHPSTANKIGFDLGRLIGLKYGYCLRQNDSVGKEEADGFLKLMKIDWSTKVTTHASVLLRQRHFDNRRQLPHPNDIEVVATKLSERLASYDYQNKTLYAQVARTALLRLMVYNRRRSGEIEELKMETYLKRRSKMDDVEESLLGELTTTEKYLIKSQELMWIRGKRGKRVPVLIPPDASKALKYMVDTEVRKLASLKPTNKYMFATRGDGVISASECIASLGNEHQQDLIHPERLNSTGYRAYMATMAQCLGLKDHQVQWLCSHLGHTENVHMTHYRFTLDGIERVQLGKLLLIQDRNLLSRYRDKKLEDIQFEDIVAVDNAPAHIESAEQMEVEVDDFELDTDDMTAGTSSGATKKKSKPAAKRLQWTESEIAELKKYAEKYLKKKKTPSRKICQSFIEESRRANGILKRRTADLIVKKISALNVKARKESSH